jgi:hypothetical protein
VSGQLHKEQCDYTLISVQFKKSELEGYTLREHGKTNGMNWSKLGASAGTVLVRF